MLVILVDHLDNISVNHQTLARLKLSNLNGRQSEAITPQSKAWKDQGSESFHLAHYAKPSRLRREKPVVSNHS